MVELACPVSDSVDLPAWSLIAAQSDPDSLQECQVLDSLPLDDHRALRLMQSMGVPLLLAWFEIAGIAPDVDSGRLDIPVTAYHDCSYVVDRNGHLPRNVSASDRNLLHVADRRILIAHSGPYRPFVGPCMRRLGEDLRGAVQAVAHIHFSYLDHTGPWDLDRPPCAEAGVFRLSVLVDRILHFALEDREEGHDPVLVDRAHEDHGDIRLAAPSGDSLEVDLVAEDLAWADLSDREDLLDTGLAV